MSAAVIAERAASHGDFAYTAKLAQELKGVVADDLAPRSDVTYRQREAIEMILTKIARIIAGDPGWPDHLRDISGYALLAIEFDPDADAKGSYDDAVRAIGERVRAGEKVPPESPFAARTELDGAGAIRGGGYRPLKLDREPGPPPNQGSAASK